MTDRVSWGKWVTDPEYALLPLWMRLFDPSEAIAALDGDHKRLTAAFRWRDTREGEDYWQKAQIEGMDDDARETLTQMLAEFLIAQGIKKLREPREKWKVCVLAWYDDQHGLRAKAYHGENEDDLRRLAEKCGIPVANISHMEIEV